MQSAEQWLSQQRKAYCSDSVTYIHYDSNDKPVSVQVSATRGRSTFKTEDSYGIVTITHAVDFLISADELKHEPERGDEILFNGKRYEVLGGSKRNGAFTPTNEPVWRWSGNENKTMRIHTKVVGDIK